uniref:NADH-ubiquinone oxidoreductase chain 2 n=1 Tax=Chudania sinica TaxID=3237924 RepID=A0AB39A5B9_9HEMI
MKINSTLILFLTTMIMGVMVSLSSNSFMMVWVGLEISMISFIPLMTLKGFMGSESSIKYFIVQSVSSSILMFGILTKLMFSYNFEMLIYISLMIKVGLAPFHNWVLCVIEGLNYFLTILLLTLMKVVPIFLMSMLNSNFNFVVLMSIMTGSILGLNQVSIRKILGYSSIFNLGFIFSVINMNSLWINYLIIYSMMLSIVIYLFFNLNLSYLNQMIMNEFNLKTKLSIWMCMLSLGGMPPMLGFINKIMIFEYLMNYSNYLLILIMIISSLMVMFYYMRVSFFSLLGFSILMKWNLNCFNSSSWLFIMLNLMFFPIFMLFKSLT